MHLIVSGGARGFQPSRCFSLCSDFIKRKSMFYTYSWSLIEKINIVYNLSHHSLLSSGCCSGMPLSIYSRRLSSFMSAVATVLLLTLLMLYTLVILTHLCFVSNVRQSLGSYTDGSKCNWSRDIEYYGTANIVYCAGYDVKMFTIYETDTAVVAGRSHCVSCVSNCNRQSGVCR